MFVKKERKKKIIPNKDQNTVKCFLIFYSKGLVEVGRKTVYVNRSKGTSVNHWKYFCISNQTKFKTGPLVKNLNNSQT